jgi:hypothetical protein
VILIKKAVLLIICTLFLLIDVSDAISGGKVYVRGYYRKNGTYVSPHYRTAPDGNPYNNYSFPGNYNPNTGEVTPGNPDTYLKRYYNRKSNRYVPYIPLQTDKNTTTEIETPSGKYRLNLPPLSTPSLDQNTSKGSDLQRLFGDKNTLPVKQKKASSLNELFK